MVFEKITQPDSADHFLSRGATVDPSPAFQSRGSGCIVVSVAAATVDIDRQNQPSPPRLATDALIVPALKSRAKLTWSLPRPGKRWLRYFFKDHKPTAKFKAPRCGETIKLLTQALYFYLKKPSCNPPSTGMTWPVVFDNRGETSRKIASAWSSGSIGVCVRVRFA